MKQTKIYINKGVSFPQFSLHKIEIKKGFQVTVFESHRKSLIQHCERSELRLHFEWKKVSQQVLDRNSNFFLYFQPHCLASDSRCVFLRHFIRPFSRILYGQWDYLVWSAYSLFVVLCLCRIHEIQRTSRRQIKSPFQIARSGKKALLHSG